MTNGQVWGCIVLGFFLLESLICVFDRRLRIRPEEQVIRVQLESRNRAIVTESRSWLDRMMGRTPDPREAVAVPTLPYGRVAWIWNVTGRPVSRDVHEAIKQEELAAMTQRALV